MRVGDITPDCVVAQSWYLFVKEHARNLQTFLIRRPQFQSNEIGTDHDNLLEYGFQRQGTIGGQVGQVGSSVLIVRRTQRFGPTRVGR